MTPTLPLVGHELGGYRLQAVLARGGMGVIYEAESPRLGTTIALKVLAPELSGDDVFRTRFLRESRIAASLNHPNVLPIFDTGAADDLLYIAMRYVEGADLRAVLKAQGRLTPTQALPLITQVGRALDAAHREGLVHRDVKPPNILIERGNDDEPDHVYLADFGVTKHVSSTSGLTQTGHFVGTIDYIAPEQIQSQHVDGRADLYSLGCVLYECLTGQPPFVRQVDAAVLFAHITEPPPRPRSVRPELPEAIDEVIARALAKDPEQRYSTCREFLTAVRAVFERVPQNFTSIPTEGIIIDDAASSGPSSSSAQPQPTQPRDIVRPSQPQAAASSGPSSSSAQPQPTQLRPAQPQAAASSGPSSSSAQAQPTQLRPAQPQAAASSGPSSSSAQAQPTQLRPAQPQAAASSGPSSSSAQAQPTQLRPSQPQGAASSGPSSSSAQAQPTQPRDIVRPSPPPGGTINGGEPPDGAVPQGDPAGSRWSRRRRGLVAIGALLLAGIAAAVVIAITSHGGRTKSSSTTSPSHVATAPTAQRQNAILQALATANESRTANGLLPASTCKAQSTTMVTCSRPAFGAIDVTFQTFPSLNSLYDAYVSEIRSLGQNPVQENFGDCTEQQTNGEVSWNHDYQHPRTYSLMDLRSGRITDDKAAGRVYCTFTNSQLYLVWTQNDGHVLGILNGSPHANTWDWWKGVHHSIDIRGSPSMSGSMQMGSSTSRTSTASSQMTGSGSSMK